MIAFWRVYKTNMQSTYDHIQYYKLGKKQKETIIVKLKALLANEKEIRLAWLFGSVIRRDSIRDLDIAIYVEPEMNFQDFLNLNAQVELELRIPVDMVQIGNTPQKLKENILACGILIKGNQRLQRQFQKTSV